MTDQDIHITVFKETDSTTYPNHIVVKKNSTGEAVHLFFSKGNLHKLVYTALSNSSNSQNVSATFQFRDGHFDPAPSFPEARIPRKAFFIPTLSCVKNIRSILFFDNNLNVAAAVRTDFNGKCLQDQPYLENHLANVKTCVNKHSPEIQSYIENNKQNC